MKAFKIVKNILIAIIGVMLIMSAASAESLFKARVSQTSYMQPRSLFYSVKAKTIGDIVTVYINESITASDNIKLDTSKISETGASFANLLNKILPGAPVNQNFDGYGGENTVANAAKVNRQTTFNDQVTTQVVQILPNGNLVIQGQKTLINAGERTNLIISGIVDPRLIDQTGGVNSNKIANLQLALTGKGTISRNNNEGIINKYVKYLF